MFLILILTFVSIVGIICAAVFGGTAGYKKIIGFAALACAVATGFSSVANAPTGHIMVARWFGSIQTGYLPDTGLQLVNPFMSYEDVEITRQEIELGANGSIRTGTSDDNFLTVDAVMPYSVNPVFAWKLLSKVPNHAVMMRNMAEAALRKGVSQKSWTQVVKDNSGDAATAIGAAWQIAVKGQLLAAGFTMEEAEIAFNFFPVQIRAAIPDPKVQEATANRSAATEDLHTQETLTSIALEIAKRRGHEGEGVQNLIKSAIGLKPTDPMPKTITVTDISKIVDAISKLERATAMQKIAEDPKRAVTVIFNGDGNGSSPNVSLPAGQTATQAAEK